MNDPTEVSVCMERFYRRQPDTVLVFAPRVRWRPHTVAVLTSSPSVDRLEMEIWVAAQRRVEWTPAHCFCEIAKLARFDWPELTAKGAVQIKFRGQSDFVFPVRVTGRLLDA